MEFGSGYKGTRKYKARQSKKEINIQQWVFPSGLPPEYYSTDHQLKSGRADGIPCFLKSMVVCDRRGG